MKKKQYTIPLVEVMQFRSEAVMDSLFGPASLPKDPENGAPERRNWWLF